MALRSCIVSVTDPQGCEHTVEVTADSLYEAVAQGLRIFRQSDWIGEIGRGQPISVVVKQPAVEHQVQLRDFQRWLDSQTPAEVSPKTRLRELLKSPP